MGSSRLVLLLALAPTLFSQNRVTDHNFHGWYNYFGDHPFTKANGNASKWGLHLEAQVRRHDFVTSWQQLLIRPAINYDVSRKLTLTAGYAYAWTHPYSNPAPGAVPTHEHRIWEQALFRYRTEHTQWTTRLRFENRFLMQPAGGYRYENRFRAWESVTVPLNKRFYLTAYDEFWTYVPPYVSNSAFDQNRAYGALGINLKPGWRLETGYMNQTLLQRSGATLESNHTFMLSLFSNAKLPR